MSSKGDDVLRRSSEPHRLGRFDTDLIARSSQAARAISHCPVLVLIDAGRSVVRIHVDDQHTSGLPWWIENLAFISSKSYNE